jgi:hypothetical protein
MEDSLEHVHDQEREVRRSVRYEHGYFVSLAQLHISCSVKPY